MAKTTRRKTRNLELRSPRWKWPPKFKEKPLIPPGDRVIILGCGTSAGSPILGCTCPTCSSSDPRNNRGRASVAIQSKGRCFLVDTSPDLRQQALANKLNWVDAVLFTHPHADHLHGIDEMRTYNYLTGRVIPAYGNEWTLREIIDRFGYIFEEGYEGGGKPRLDLHLMQRPRAIVGVKVIPLPVDHGSMPVLGYRIKDIAYITDCSSVPDRTFRSLKNLDVLVLDCLRPGKHTTHLSVDEAIILAHKIKAKRTYFTHMGHEIEYNDFAKSLPATMQPAYDGLVIECTGGNDP